MLRLGAVLYQVGFQVVTALSTAALSYSLLLRFMCRSSVIWRTVCIPVIGEYVYALDASTDRGAGVRYKIGSFAAGPCLVQG